MVRVAKNVKDMLDKSMQERKTHLQVNNSILGVADMKRNFSMGLFFPFDFCHHIDSTNDDTQKS